MQPFKINISLKDSVAVAGETEGYKVFNETQLRVAQRNVTAGYTTLVQGKINNDSTWTTLATLTGDVLSSAIDISAYDMVRFNVTVAGSNGSLYASSFFPKALSSGAGGGNSFETIQVSSGTSPVAESATDTLTLTSSDGSVTITGTAGTDTIDFSTGAATNLNVLRLESSGCLTGGVLSIGTGGADVATTFSLTSGTGQIVDNSVNPPTLTAVTWTTKTDVVITNIATQALTYIAIDSSGNVVQSTSDWGPEQMRQYVEIGLVAHPNLVVVTDINQMNQVAYNPLNQLGDLIYGLKIFNVEGNVFSANGANLTINKSVGKLFSQGLNYTSLTTNPHVKTEIALTGATLRMLNQSGASSANTTLVDVANYDLAGVTTAMDNNKFCIHRIYLFPSNLVGIQRGQNQYASLAEAKGAIQTETHIIAPGVANGILRGFLIFKKSITVLNDPLTAFFLEAPKFGGTAGVGGQSVTTLQNAYNNSSTSEILTDSTRGALTIHRGSAADTDDVFEILNGAGAIVGYIKGNGATDIIATGKSVALNVNSLFV